MLKKIMMVLILISVILYIGIWVSMANVLKAHIKGYIRWYDESHNVQSSYQLSTHGFPFGIKVDVNDYQYTSDEGENHHDFSSEYESPITLSMSPMMKSLHVHINGTSHDKYTVSEEDPLSVYLKLGAYQLTHFEDKEYTINFGQNLLFKLTKINNWKDYVNRIRGVTLKGNKESFSLLDADGEKQKVWWNYDASAPYILHLGWNPLSKKEEKVSDLHFSGTFHGFDVNLDESEFKDNVTQQWLPLLGQHDFEFTEFDVSFETTLSDFMGVLNDINWVLFFDIDSFLKLSKSKRTGLMHSLSSQSGESKVISASLNADWPIAKGSWKLTPKSTNGNKQLFSSRINVKTKEGFANYLLASRGKEDFQPQHDFRELDDLQLMVSYDVEAPDFWRPMHLDQFLLTPSQDLGGMYYRDSKNGPNLSVTSHKDLGSFWVNLDEAVRWSDRCPQLWDHSIKKITKNVQKLLKKHRSKEDVFQKVVDGKQDATPIEIDAWTERGWLSCSPTPKKAAIAPIFFYV